MKKKPIARIIPKQPKLPEHVKTFSSLDEYDLPPELEQCNKLKNWAIESSVKTHKIAAMMTTITIASAITARKYYTETDAPTSLYTILVLPTGSGKDMVAKIPQKLITDSIVLANVTSIGALEDIICSSPAITQIIDEYGDTLGNMLSEKNSNLKDILAMLKSIYGSGDREYQFRIYSSGGGKEKLKRRTVNKPAYGLCGLSTEHQLMDKLSENMISDGFLNRFIIINGYEIAPYFPPVLIKDTPIAVLEHIDMINKIQSSKTIKMDNECSNFYHEIIGDADLPDTDIYLWVDGDEKRREISARWRENSIRLATALAGYEQFETLPLWLLKWSYSFVKFNSISFLKSFENRKNKSINTETLDAVLNWFKQHKGKWISRTTIANKATRLSAMLSKDRNIILSELVERGHLELRVSGNTFEYAYRPTQPQQP